MENIEFFTLIFAAFTFILGINLASHGIAAGISALSCGCFIGFAYMVGEYMDDRAFLFIMYALSLCPLVNAICRYNQWKEERRRTANMEFVRDLLSIMHKAAKLDKQPDMNTIEGACEVLLRLIIKEDAPHIAEFINAFRANIDTTKK